jgi:hypothetical protein
MAAGSQPYLLDCSFINSNHRNEEMNCFAGELQCFLVGQALPSTVVDMVDPNDGISGFILNGRETDVLFCGATVGSMKLQAKTYTYPVYYEILHIFPRHYGHHEASIN